MRLFLTATSERGKPVTKSGNDKLEITLTKDRILRYFIYFRDSRLVVEDIPTQKEVLRLELHHDIGNQYNGVKCDKDCPIHYKYEENPECKCYRMGFHDMEAYKRKIECECDCHSQVECDDCGDKQVDGKCLACRGGIEI